MIGKSTILIFSLLILLGTMVDGLTIDLIAQQQSVEVPPKVVTSDRLPLSVPGEILVTFDSHVTEDQVHAMAKEHGMTILEMNQALDLYRMSVAGSVQDGIALARAHPFVETARPNYILADVGGESITLLDMESAIQQLPIPLRQIYTTSQNKEKLLRTMVNNKIFAKAAKEEKLDEMSEVKRRIGAAIEWTLAQDFQRQVLEHISMSEKELRDYYDEHVWAFQTPEQIKIREIVVDSKEKAHEIRKLIEEGKEFEQIARERSIGATAHSGGELGWFGRGRLDHGLEQAGFALKVGEISGIIETMSGYHLIKLEGRRSARQQSFSEARNRIRQLLLKVKEKEHTEKKRKELEYKYGVRLYTDLLPKINVHTTTGEARHTDSVQSFQQILEKPD